MCAQTSVNKFILLYDPLQFLVSFLFLRTCTLSFLESTVLGVREGKTRALLKYY